MSRTTREHLVEADVLTIEGTWSRELDHDHDRAHPWGPMSPVLVLDGVIVARRPLTEEEIAEILVCDSLDAKIAEADAHEAAMTPAGAQRCIAYGEGHRAVYRWVWWSVYQQGWRRGRDLSTADLAARSSTERAAVAAHRDDLFLGDLTPIPA